MRIPFIFSALLVCTFYPSSIFSQDSLKLKQLYTLLLSDNQADTAQVRIWLELADIYRTISRDSSRKYLEKAENKLNSIRSPKLLARMYAQKANEYTRQFKYDSVLHFLEQSQEISEDFYDYITLKKILFGYGIYYHYTEQFDSALLYNQKAIEFVDSTDHADLSSLYYNRAAVFMIRGSHEQARPNFVLSKSHADLGGSFSSAMGALKGLLYLATQIDHNLDSLDLYLAEAKALCDQSASPEVCMDYHQQAGLAYNNLGDMDKSRMHHELALSYARQLNSEYSTLSFLSHLAQLEVQLKNYNQAEHYFTQYDSIFRKDPQNYTGLHAYQVWADMQTDRGLYKEAISLYKQRATLMDSVHTRIRKERLEEAETRYQSMLKETELLKKESDLKSARQAQKHWMLVGLCLIAVLALGLIIFRQKLRQNALSLEVQKNVIQHLEQQNKILGLSSLIEGQEKERIRIAKDLHDGLGSLLASVKAHYEKIFKLAAPEQEIHKYRQAQTMMDDAVDEVRRISHNMMPPLLRTNGLASAVQSFLQGLAGTHNLGLVLDIRNMSEPIDENKALFIYRIIQELTNNVIKHAEASEIQLQMICLNDQIQIIFEDDGKGFDYDPNSTGVGLRSIRSRIDYLGGEIEYISENNNGTTIEINVPL